ncbi:MAG: hypothetical protein ABI626_08915 [Sphingomicrobium sp.]
MTTHAQFYLTRAALARDLADGSQLDNVKESHLRAAEAWDGFAARAIKADLMRAEELKRKAGDAAATESEEDPAISAENPDFRQVEEKNENSRSLSVF